MENSNLNSLKSNTRKTAVMLTDSKDLIATKWAKKQTNILFALAKNCIDEQQAQVLRDHSWEEYKRELAETEQPLVDRRSL